MTRSTNIPFPFSAEGIKRTTELGRQIREQRERHRALMDGKAVAHPGDAGWHFANENGVMTALAIGPTMRITYA